MNTKKRIIYRGYQLCTEIWIKGIAFRAFRQGRIDSKWRQILCRVAEDFPSVHTYKMIRGFLDDRIILKKKAVSWQDRSAPTVVCVEKDSMVFLKNFLPYYRNMGVRHFVFIDNVSGDGTEQFLMEQEDVTLYSAPWPFEHRRKSGWLLQAIEETGTDRWYLRLDSDEFLTWEGMETSSLRQLVADMKKAGLRALRGVMLDMYPAYDLLDVSRDDSGFMEEYCWFDDGTSFRTDPSSGEIFGGMRFRTTGAYLRMDKYVLFHPGRGCVPVTSHDVTGLEKTQMQQACHCVLRHYKFLPSEAEKYRNISQNPDSGYSAYKQVRKYAGIVDKNVNAFSSEHSVQYESSHSLRALKLISPLP